MTKRWFVKILCAVVLLSAQSAFAQNDEEEGGGGWPGGVNISGGYTHFMWKHASLDRYMASHNASLGTGGTNFSALKWRRPVSAGAEVDFGMVSLAYYRHFSEATTEARNSLGSTHTLLVKAPTNDINMYLMIPHAVFRVGLMVGYTQQNLQINSTYLRGANDTVGLIPVLGNNYKVTGDRVFTFGGRFDFRPVKYVSLSVEYNNVGLFQKQSPDVIYAKQPFVTPNGIVAPVFMPENVADYYNNDVRSLGNGQVVSGLYNGGRINMRLNFYPWSW
jgi:hypothetical protein